MFDYITENLKKINYNIDNLCAKYNLPPPEIMGATKYVDIELITFAFENGLKYVGENYVKHYLEKQKKYPQELKVDIIGHLQSNKINHTVNQHIRYIQSVDSIKIAELINKRAKELNFVQSIFLEINIGDEDTKTGINPNQLENILLQTSKLENVKIKGLMYMPPFGKEEYFLPKGQELFEKYKADFNLEIISAGLSDSYLTAIKYGSGLIRLGTAIFGDRIIR
jgi:pyridoxal phosphate enzyme (YggS family)